MWSRLAATVAVPVERGDTGEPEKEVAEVAVEVEAGVLGVWVCKEPRRTDWGEMAADSGRLRVPRVGN